MRLVEIVNGLLTRYESRLLPDPSKQTNVDSPDARALSDLIDTLLRVDSGRYGMCEECGDVISYQRLLEAPTSVYCGACSGHETWRPAKMPS